MDERNDRDGRPWHRDVRIIDPEEAGTAGLSGADDPRLDPAGDRQPSSDWAAAGGDEPDRRDGEDEPMTDETYHEERQTTVFDDLGETEAVGGAGEYEPADGPAITLEGHTSPPGTDPPTGEGPRLRPDADEEGEEDLSAWGELESRPQWREGAEEWDDVGDWDDEEEPESLGFEETRVGTLDTTRSEQSESYSYDEDFERFEERRDAGASAETDLEPDRSPTGSFPAPEAAPSSAKEITEDVGGSPQGRRRSAPRRPDRSAGSRPPRQPASSRREAARAGRGADQVATRVVAGVALLAVLLIFYFVGSAALMVLSAVVAGAAAAEGYGMLQRAGFRPATLLGLVASVAIIGAAYWRGQEALPLVIALAFAGSMLWYLFRIVEARPLVNIAVTNLLFIWIGVLASFGALMLRGRDGRGLFLGAVVVAVGADIAAYFAGSRLGKRPLARSVSPGKTWEGAAAGLIAALIIGAIIGKALTPWGGMKHGLVFGLLVGIIAPLGDLSESMIKRDLGVKNSGNLIPGHGGLLDRMDAILWALPIAYFLSTWTGILKG